MKIPRAIAKTKTGRQGSATLVVLALVSIMAILVTANLAAVRLLNLDLRLTEQRQLQRLNHPRPAPAKPQNNLQTHG